MKLFYFIVIVNVLTVVGVIGFVVWQSIDSGSPLGLVILFLIMMGFLGFFIYIDVPHTLWRRHIITTGMQTRAVILECRLAGKNMYTGGTEHSRGRLTAQQVVLKLEIHPTNEMAYIVEDRLWINPAHLIRISPGCELQVAVARNNAKWAVAMPETVNVSMNSNAKIYKSLEPLSDTSTPNVILPDSQPLSFANSEIMEWVKRGNILEAIREHRKIHGTNYEDAKAAVYDMQARISAQK